MFKKEVKFKCPYCGSHSVKADWENGNYVLLCSDCNALDQFPITSSEEDEHFFDMDYNKWIEHEWPEYTETCSDGCCDIPLPDEDGKNSSLGDAEPTKEWYMRRITVLEHQINDQELIIECLLDKIRYERNR